MTYGKKDFALDTKYIQSQDEATGLMKWLVEKVTKPRKSIGVKIFSIPTIQLGDITKWKEWDIDYKSIDLVLSGSPCQDLSIAGKRSGINGSRSSLFYVFIEILEHIQSLNPNVLFLQENVGSAS